MADRRCARSRLRIGSTTLMRNGSAGYAGIHASPCSECHQSNIAARRSKAPRYTARMRRGKRIFWGVGAVCLAACGLLAAGLAWPSPRARVVLAWSSEQVQSAWISLQSESAWTDAVPAPGLTVAIDAPARALEGRRERLELFVRVAPERPAFAA